MSLTRIQIVNLALDQAGLDTSYQAKARNWLNFVTQKLAGQYNYKFYLETASDVPFVQNITSYNLPADFSKTDTIYRVSSTGTLGDQIFVLESYRFDQYARGLAGDPSLAMVDTEAGVIRFNTLPTSTTATSFRLRYFKKPATLSLDNTDDAVVPDFKDQNVLVQELMQMAYENLDDERFSDKRAEAKDANQKLQRNEFQAVDTGQIDLSHANFVRRRRR